MFANLDAQELEGQEAAVLVDRYTYMDLLPCSPVELKMMGYVVSTNPTLLLFSTTLKSGISRKESPPSSFKFIKGCLRRAVVLTHEKL